MSEFDLIEEDSSEQPIITGEVKMVAPMEFVTSDYAPSEEPIVEATTEQSEVVPEVGTPEAVAPEVEVKPKEVVAEVPKDVVEEKPTIEPEVVEYDPYEKLGLTDDSHKKYLEKVIDAIKTNTLNELYATTTVDYDAMNEVELLQYDIEQKVKKEYPNASKRALELTIKKEVERVLDEHNITSDDEEEAEIGTELLKMKMDKVREGLKSIQSSYAPPKYEAKAAEIDPSIAEAQKQAEQIRNEFVSFVEKSQELLEVERTKAVSFGDFKVELPEGVNPKEQTLDVNKFLTPFFSKDGKLDMAKWLKTIAIASDPDKFTQDAINYGKSIQKKEGFEGMRGIEKPANDAIGNKSSGEYVISDVRHVHN